MTKVTRFSPAAAPPRIHIWLPIHKSWRAMDLPHQAPLTPEKAPAATRLQRRTPKRDPLIRRPRHRHMKPPPGPPSPTEGTPPPLCPEPLLRGPSAVDLRRGRHPHVVAGRDAASLGGAVAAGRSRDAMYRPSRKLRHGRGTRDPRRPLHRRRTCYPDGHL